MSTPSKVGEVPFPCNPDGFSFNLLISWDLSWVPISLDFIYSVGSEMNFVHSSNVFQITIVSSFWVWNFLCQTSLFYTNTPAYLCQIVVCGCWALFGCDKVSLFLVGEVRMPSGKTARPHITDNKDGTVTVRYAPTEKGLHEMDIKYDGSHIPGRKPWVVSLNSVSVS